MLSFNMFLASRPLFANSFTDCCGSVTLENVVGARGVTKLKTEAMSSGLCFVKESLGARAADPRFFDFGFAVCPCRGSHGAVTFERATRRPKSSNLPLNMKWLWAEWVVSPFAAVYNPYSPSQKAHGFQELFVRKRSH